MIFKRISFYLAYWNYIRVLSIPILMIIVLIFISCFLQSGPVPVFPVAISVLVLFFLIIMLFLSINGLTESIEFSGSMVIIKNNKSIKELPCNELSIYEFLTDSQPRRLREGIRISGKNNISHTVWKYEFRPEDWREIRHQLEQITCNK